MKVMAFACPHGAGKSRVAAAWFEAAGLPDWRAVSFACEVPDPTVSAATSRVVAGTDAEAFLDRSQPRAWLAAGVDRAVAIDGERPGAAVWRLTHPWPSQEAAEEIRLRVAALVADLAEEPGGVRG